MYLALITIQNYISIKLCFLKIKECNVVVQSLKKAFFLPFSVPPKDLPRKFIHFIIVSFLNIHSF